jgi:predicted permease
MTVAIITAVMEIFGLFTIGALARFLGYIREDEVDRWSKLVLDFLFPLFTFSSIVNGFKAGQLHTLWPLPVIGFGLILIGTIAGMMFQKGLFTKDPDMRRSFIHFCAVNNSSYLPIIVIRNIWGDGALANLFFLNLGSTLGVWTIGVAVLGATSAKGAFKNLFTPNLAAVILSIIVCLTGLQNHIPHLLQKIISSAGSASVPLILVLIGASLAQRSALKISWPVFYITGIRLLILPFSSVLILKLLPLSPEVFSVSAIVSLMPVAVSSVIMTRRYGGSPDYAASTAVFSTISAIITIPVGMWLLFH